MNASLQAALVLALAATANATAASAPPDASFTVYSGAITLHPSEVHNRAEPAFDIPKTVADQFDGVNSKMVIVDTKLDLVTRDEHGAETPVPLYDVYNHHFIMYLGDYYSTSALYKKFQGKDPIGGEPCWRDHVDQTKGNGTDHADCSIASMARGPSCLARIRAADRRIQVAHLGGSTGGEYRNNPHNYSGSFGEIVPGKPESILGIFHLINTRNTTKHDGGPADYSPYLECPCTSDRVFNVPNQSIDGCVASPPFFCNEKFLSTKPPNPSCALSTYKGGYRCCGHGVLLAPTSADRRAALQQETTTIYAKVTVTYRKSTPDTRDLFSCIQDVTTTMTRSGTVDHEGPAIGNIEYDVPVCPAGTNEEDCVFTMTNVEPVLFFNNTRPVDLYYVVAHVHTGALSATLHDEATGELLCDADLTYGKSNHAGDEEGYLVGIAPCVFPKGRRMEFGTLLRSTITYNASAAIHGVMGLWLNKCAMAGV